MFKLQKKLKDNAVRHGRINTSHGAIKTPVFLPDATRGFIKTLSNNDLEELDVGAMVVNTYHLYLQPGLKKIKRAACLDKSTPRQGGIHKFMSWKGPLLSDSGGFQVFSLIHQNPQMGKITDKQVVFKSPIDGSKHILTPEKSIQIQFNLGVDMMVCLDDCPPNDCKKKDLEKAVERTIKWAERCAKEYDKRIKKHKLNKDNRPLIFSVIQGGTDLELRKKCFMGLQEVAPKNGWDGYGYGARPVDSRGNFLEEVLEYTANLIPEDKIKFALGVGKPEDIVRCAKMGWDMFDCVIPTREGRHGRLFLWRNVILEGGAKHRPIGSRDSTASDLPESNSGGRVALFQNDKGINFYNTINIVNAKFATDFSPINKDSKLKELREYSMAYLHHLFKLKEPLGQRLATLNNLEFYLGLMEGLREKT